MEDVVYGQRRGAEEEGVRGEKGREGKENGRERERERARD